MCIIIVQPYGVEPIAKDEFRRAWVSNPEGAGLMYAQSNKLRIFKPYWKLKHFWRAYQEAQAKAESAIVLHFRIATGGKLNAVNTHPHIVAATRDVGVVHNGILPSIGVDTPCWSDTVQWVNHIWKDSPREVLLSTEFAEHLATLIGWSNKLVFMDSEGNYSIVNEVSGFWAKDGCWRSNHGSELRTYCAMNRATPWPYSDSGEAEIADWRAQWDEYVAQEREDAFALGYQNIAWRNND